MNAKQRRTSRRAHKKAEWLLKQKSSAIKRLVMRALNSFAKADTRKSSAPATADKLKLYPYRLRLPKTARLVRKQKRHGKEFARFM